MDKQAAKKEPGTDVVSIADSAAIMQVIERMATDPNTDVVKMERLLDMHERILNRNAEQAYTEALAAAQAEMRPVAADASNPQTKSKYASYAALDKALRPIYSNHGFALSFDQGRDAPEDSVEVLCYVGHIGGFTRTHRTLMPADGKGAKGGDVMTKTHAVGAANSYGMRYLLKFIFNVAVGEDDNDGNAIDAPINAEQKDVLIDLIKKTGGDIAGKGGKAFLKFFGAESLDELPGSKYAAAKSALELKIKAKKGAAK